MAKYDIDVQLTGENGNIFNLISLVKRSLKKNNVPNIEIETMINEITSSNSYDEALGKLEEWVTVY